MQDRSSGEQVRREDITKSILIIEKIGPAEKFGYYNHFSLDSEVKKKVRWHKIEYKLIDESFGNGKWRFRFSTGLAYNLGENGTKIFQSLVDEVVKEHGDFEGFIEGKDGKPLLTEKTRAIRSALVDRVDAYNKTICCIPDEKKYNLQQILSNCGVTKEMWEEHKDLPWIIQWFRLSRKLYDKLYNNSDYDAFFMGLSNDAELWYEEKENQCYAYFQVEDMNLPYNKWEDLIDMDEYVDVRLSDMDGHPLKDDEGNWIKECSPKEMKLLLIVDYDAGDNILKELVHHIEHMED